MWKYWCVFYCLWVAPRQAIFIFCNNMYYIMHLNVVFLAGLYDPPDIHARQNYLKWFFFSKSQIFFFKYASYKIKNWKLQFSKFCFKLAVFTTMRFLFYKAWLKSACIYNNFQHLFHGLKKVSTNFADKIVHWLLQRYARKKNTFNYVTLIFPFYDQLL